MEKINMDRYLYLWKINIEKITVETVENSNF